ncbi:uncharacterized protein F5147DRAFT_414828 [Suillus discolor]|uniref:Uncharacterized protein n=1 Tax=Suillus discolor TaxID=1912936 RepID=A0A9P7FGH0_9AGAM|nr:uncharacterized protein F5147DRAFT_414828 [Suillus discolor]KAG2115317.1 hypothetical protein F5147DRAFT_414828 [Suillus discolor]
MPPLTGNVNVAIRLIGEVTISTNSSTATPSTNTEHATRISIPAIVGGTAAGIALAVAVAVGWKWWSSIVRHSDKKRRSRRQNVLRRHDRTTPNKPSEAGGPSSNSDSTGCSDAKKSLADSSPKTMGAISPSPTPIQHSLRMAAPLPPPPIKPPRNPARALRRPSGQFKESLARGSRSSFAWASNRLSHKSSISTASMYSTQTYEEQQVRVPAAVITAALGGTRHLSRLGHSSDPYTIGEEQTELVVPSSSLRPSAHIDANIAQLHRVSNISAGSLGLQQGAQTTDSIGVAYGGEES